MKPIEEYWPPFLQEVKELKEIAKAENPEVEALRKSTDELIADQFIETATERGIRRREKLLKITPHKDDDLEYRRSRVLARWNDRIPYTYRVLVSRLDQLFGDNYDLDLLHNEYLLKIEINTFNWREYDTMIDDIRLMIPANMTIQSALIQKIRGTFFIASSMLGGEEITVYPWSPRDLSSKGKVYVATGNDTGLDTTTVYPKGSE